MKINALATLLDNEKMQHYHTMMIGWVTGFIAFLGLHDIIVDRVVTLIFALITAFISGFLASMGKELYELTKIKVKKYWKKWKH